MFFHVQAVQSFQIRQLMAAQIFHLWNAGARLAQSVEHQTFKAKGIPCPKVI